MENWYDAAAAAAGQSKRRSQRTANVPWSYGQPNSPATTVFRNEMLHRCAPCAVVNKPYSVVMTEAADISLLSVRRSTVTGIILNEMAPKELSGLMVAIETMRKRNEEVALKNLRKKRKTYESTLQAIDTSISVRETKLRRLSCNIENEEINSQVIELTTEEAAKAEEPEDD